MMPPASPLSSRPPSFVGRQAELAALTERLDAAAEGRGSLALVAGEPGIGKTALCRRFAATVAARGGRILIGHCAELGVASLPYLPFVEALRAHVEAGDPAALAAAHGADAVEVARLVPALRAAVASVLEAPNSGGERAEARYRLLQGVTGFLARTARAAPPLTLILEDLHDADQGALDLLAQVIGVLEQTPLLVVGSYRDVEVDGAHPLSRLIASARRRAPVVRLTLRGLAPADVRALVHEVGGQVAPAVADTVYRQSEGNPLFVLEVTRELLSGGAGAVGDASGEPALAVPTPAVPDGLREVIEQRLARLGEPARQILATAAVLGHSFAFHDLWPVVDNQEQQVAALEAAVRLGIIHEEAGVGGARYRFTHALFHQALAAGLGAARRGLLHQRIGRALLERYAGQEAEHAAELAEHLLRSPDPADLARAVTYCNLGAQRARAVYAHGEAARLTEQALAAHAVAHPTDASGRCDLLLALGMTLHEGGAPARTVGEIAPAAYVLARRLGDPVRAAYACNLVFWGLLSQFHPRVLYATPAAALWADRADRCAPPDSALRVCADTFLAGVHTATAIDRKGVCIATRALDLAHRLGDADLLSYAAAAWLFNSAAPDHAERRLRLIEEIIELPRAGVTMGALALFLSYAANDFYRWGERARAEAALGDLADLEARTGEARLSLAAGRAEPHISLLDGRLHEAVAAADRLIAHGADRGLEAFAREHVDIEMVARPLLHLGRPETALRRAPVEPLQALCRAHGGDIAWAAAYLDRMLAERPAIATVEDQTALHTDTLNLETAVLAGHTAATTALYRRLTPYGRLTTGMVNATCVGRHLGAAAAALLGRADEARRHYRDALDVAERLAFRPEIALIQLELAELAAVSPAERPRGDSRDPHRTGDAGADARTLLDRAIPALRAMEMQPALDRALRLAVTLAGARPDRRPAPGPAYPDGLTAREVEVLRLVVAGKSNAEIAEVLVMSTRTAERHLANIYGKIGAGGKTARAAATAYALTHGLVPADTGNLLITFTKDT